ncbi:MAG: YVTN family beta-propeller protein [Polaribacter sp.]|jgi:YVTN family beta-propeller protein|tara:strand:+ start:457 stop:762 length:306 start_codon:yes stop_codon:yes gene_type:complete
MIKRRDTIIVGTQDSNVEIGRSCKNDPVLYINTLIRRSIIRSEIAIHYNVNNIVILIHPNGKYAFTANSNSNRIEVLDLNILTIISSIKTGLIPDGMTLIK